MVSEEQELDCRQRAEKASLVTSPVEQGELLLQVLNAYQEENVKNRRLVSGIGDRA